jgi:hypothetical protein
VHREKVATGFSQKMHDNTVSGLRFDSIKTQAWLLEPGGAAGGRAPPGDQ